MSLNRKEVQPIDLDAYSGFVKKHADIIEHYLTVDKIGDPETTLQNTYYLEHAV
ncbi:hypothetical protein SAMN04487895_112154 [Paenibacillus sophorae]|uniref:Uncharacterized protein n=1 Tax=Paenibacillus sophorae TaxID=1333845 RepID=A0A1H8SX83_9BACL|nr:hypothetical protein [Paenibacillus sophorae]QWU15597.1 hypothetical protein KP014_27800 [Paenibacillus sophorae]SEO83370.1 hypothetical protein SAMN04487895_112154 [Paenibacillus sophorae]